MNVLMHGTLGLLRFLVKEKLGVLENLCTNDSVTRMRPTHGRTRLTRLSDSLARLAADTADLPNRFPARLSALQTESL